MRKKIFLACLFMFPLLAFSREKNALAVLDLEGKNVDQAKAEAVTDLLRTELFNSGSFKVIERQKIRHILQEQQFQSTGLTEMDQAVEIGRLLNVQRIMIGTVTRLGSTYIINTRIVDVQSAAVVMAEAVERRGGEEQLAGAIAELATTISYKIGLEGSIIRIGPDEVFVDLGEADGVQPGQVFDIIHPGDVITDLEGRIIGNTQDVIGRVTITKVQDKFSVASITSQTKKFSKGDLACPKTERDKHAKSAKKPNAKKQTEGDAQATEVPIIF